MAKMGKYCKAYSLNKLRKFHQWSEYNKNTRKEKKVIDTDEVEIERELTDDDFLYVQENYVVTDGIFKDENVIFDNITPEWIDFCKNTLLFEVPVHEPVKIEEVSGIQDNANS